MVCEGSVPFRDGNEFPLELSGRVKLSEEGRESGRREGGD